MLPGCTAWRLAGQSAALGAGFCSASPGLWAASSPRPSRRDPAGVCRASGKLTQHSGLQAHLGRCKWQGLLFKSRVILHRVCRTHHAHARTTHMHAPRFLSTPWSAETWPFPVLSTANGAVTSVAHTSSRCWSSLLWVDAWGGRGAGSQGRSGFSFLKNLHRVFQNRRTDSHPPQQCTGVPFPQPGRHVRPW